MKEDEEEDINDNLEEDDSQNDAHEELADVVGPAVEHHF